MSSCKKKKLGYIPPVARNVSVYSVCFQITNESKNVFAVEVGEEEMDEVQRNMYSHLRRLVEERDGYVEEIRDLSQALEDLHHNHQELQAVTTAQKTASSSATLTPPGAPSGGSSTPEKHHMAVELAEYKAKLRKLRQEA